MCYAGAMLESLKDIEAVQGLNSEQIRELFRERVRAVTHPFDTYQYRITLKYFDAALRALETVTPETCVRAAIAAFAQRAFDERASCEAIEANPYAARNTRGRLYIGHAMAADYERLAAIWTIARHDRKPTTVLGI